MALRQFNPVTASLRGTVLIDRSELWKGKPVKGLTEGKNHSGGRNNHGRTTMRFRVAATSNPTARSTSSGASSTCPPRSSGWNTTRTGRRSSR